MTTALWQPIFTRWLAFVWMEAITTDAPAGGEATAKLLEASILHEIQAPVTGTGPAEDCTRGCSGRTHASG